MTNDDHVPPTTPFDLELSTLGAYRALLEGKLTVVDRFDRDGRTYLVVASSVPSTPYGRALTQRERRAASLLRAGHANKLIAAELSLSESRMSDVLRSVAEKLGARSRVDLVRLLASLPDLAEPVCEEAS